jgi:hypothetical protein
MRGQQLDGDSHGILVATKHQFIRRAYLSDSFESPDRNPWPG